MPSRTGAKSGQSPEGTVNWVEYNSKTGYVEIGWFPRSDTSWNGSITVGAMPDANGRPLRRSYPLPTSAA